MIKKKDGFTLIELLVVMFILGLLVAIVGPRLLRFIRPAQSNAARVQIANFEQALQHYFLEHNGKYPSSLGELTPEYMEEVPLDPWGNPYVYQYPGTHNRDFDIESYGQDGSPGGGDDITNYGS